MKKHSIEKGDLINYNEKTWTVISTDEIGFLINKKDKYGVEQAFLKWSLVEEASE